MSCFLDEDNSGQNALSVGSKVMLQLYPSATNNMQRCFRFCCYALVYRLHKTLDEIPDISLFQLMRWIAYLKRIHSN